MKYSNNIIQQLRNLLIIGSLVSSLTSCEEVINPTLIAADPIVAIDAWLTDVPGESRVVVTKTDPFNSQGDINFVQDAIVTVIGGGETRLLEEDPREPGVYRPFSTDFEVLAGEEYVLNARVEGAIYTAKVRTRSTPMIDSITTEFKDFPNDDLDGQYITFHFQDPPNTSNYYFWEVFRNGELYGQEIFIINDENIDTTAFSIEHPLPFLITDIAEVRLHSLPRASYEFFQGLKLLVDSGSPSQSPPENPITNLENNTSLSDTDPLPVVGYFHITTSSSFAIEIP